MGNLDCTLSDAELIDTCREWIYGMCKNEKKWQMTIPVDLNRDTDILLSEIIRRFETSKERIEELETAIYEAVLVKIDSGELKKIYDARERLKKLLKEKS